MHALLGNTMQVSTFFLLGNQTQPGKKMSILSYMTGRCCQFVVLRCAYVFFPPYREEICGYLSLTVIYHMHTHLIMVAKLSIEVSMYMYCHYSHSINRVLQSDRAVGQYWSSR